MDLQRHLIQNGIMMVRASVTEWGDDGSAELEAIRTRLKRFRVQWEGRVARQAYKTLSVQPERGARRQVYLLLASNPLARKFVAARKTMGKYVDQFLAEHNEVTRRELDLDGWLPSGALRCAAVQIKRYGATSQRKLSSEQARAFLVKVGRADKFPARPSGFCMRSRTGYRYVLEVRQRPDEGIKELPLREWVVIVSQTKLDDRLASETPVEGRRRSGDKIWRESRGHAFLGQSKNKRSRLYALAAGAD